MNSATFVQKFWNYCNLGAALEQFRLIANDLSEQEGTEKTS